MTAPTVAADTSLDATVKMLGDSLAELESDEGDLRDILTQVGEIIARISETFAELRALPESLPEPMIGPDCSQALQALSEACSDEAVKSLTAVEEALRAAEIAVQSAREATAAAEASFADLRASYEGAILTDVTRWHTSGE